MKDLAHASRAEPRMHGIRTERAADQRLARPPSPVAPTPNPRRCPGQMMEQRLEVAAQSGIVRAQLREFSTVDRSDSGRASTACQTRSTSSHRSGIVDAARLVR